MKTSSFLIFLLLLAWVCPVAMAASAKTTWGLNDVSILFPLPESLEQVALLKPTSVGAQGELLPMAIFKKLPALDKHEDPEITYSKLVMVAARIDPDVRQIRVIYQPLTRGMPWEASVITKDMGVHVFFEMPAAEMQSFVAGYLKLKQEFSVKGSFGTLSIHPVLQAEKMQGPFSQKLKSLLLQFIGQKRISQVTFMELRSIGGVWGFGGFKVAAEKLTRFKVPRLDAYTQEFVNPSQGSFIGAQLTPAPQGTDTFNGIVTDAIDPTSLVNEVAATYRVENPLVHTQDSVDCVSCHTATNARNWVQARMPEAIEGHSFKVYTSNFNLKNESQGIRTSHLRMFGYQGSQMAIGQRVINESAEVARKLNSH